MALLLVLVGPVVLRQLVPAEARHFEYVTLDELEFTEVAFRNETQDIELGGMLFVPAGAGPFPAAVIIHGSGTSRRDNGWYLTLTKHLQDNGIAVLLPDKRGSVGSGGDWRTSSMEDLATDTIAAVEFVRSQPAVDSDQVGIVGMSQGGWIAPIVGTELPDLSFIVSVVGSAVTPREQLLYEENHNIRQMGFLPGISNVLAYLGAANVRYLAQPEFYRLVDDFDPLPYWRQVQSESAVLLGADDTNVPSDESARRLLALDKPNIGVTVYPGSGHALESPVGEGNALMRPDALAEISRFILRVDSDD